MLVLAVAEFLVAKKWDISTERDLRKLGAISDAEKIDYLSCDLDSRRNDERAAFEMKYLKSPAGKVSQEAVASTTPLERVMDDIMKLSFVDHPSWRSFLVIARHKSVSLHKCLPKDCDPRRLVFTPDDLHDSKDLYVQPSSALKSRIKLKFNGRLPRNKSLIRLEEVVCGQMLVSLFEVRL